MALFKKEMSDDVKSGLRSLRADVMTKLKEHEKKLRKVLTEEVCNEIVAVVEKNKVNLPPLTEELHDEEILAYIVALEKPEAAQKIATLIAELNEMSEKYNLGSSNKSQK